MKQPRIKARRATAVALLIAIAWAPAAIAEVYTVNINGLAFDPQDLDIVVGDTVTWVNDGGMNNVVADDGSFDSGPPSTDLWEYSHTFHHGGVITYRSMQQPDTLVGTINVEGIFGDRFESGNVDAWSDDTIPVLPNCNCYFSGDCATGFCDWGVLTNEDNCYWRENKPNGVPNAGCDVAYDGPWIGGICDGVCSASAQGSTLGWEERSLILQGTELWAEALLAPAIAGGGPVDPQLAKEAQTLDFQSSDSSFALGRQITDLLVVAGAPGFGEHFCFFEGHPGELDPDLYVDLSDDSCRQISTQSAVDALLAELVQPGTGGQHLEGIRDACPDWQGMFAPRCPEGPNALACVEERIANLAVFLNTPRDLGDYLREMFNNPLTDDAP